MDKVDIPGDKQADESKTKSEMARKLSPEEKIEMRREENQEKEKLLEREAEKYV